jgi:3'-phosphoadenosine 5'-phosphosulfate sulfotransferase (PAPS reductase)/FAD synthetase
MKPRLTISNSGGRTSAVMTKLCLEQYADTHEIVVTFANTGCEHPATLDFVKACDDNWGFNTVWLEAVVGPPGVGIRHRIVDYETASRNGEPFEAYIAKHGIPNRTAPQCTSRLKTEVMEDYLKSLGWTTTLGKRDYWTAIGIRADEIDRMSSQADRYKFIYPMIDNGWTKDRVNAYMRQYDFDLALPNDAFGNCVWCWKKSLRKLLTVAKADPSAFDFPARMESEYGTYKADKSGGRRVFFREFRSTQDILAMSKLPFVPYQDSSQITIWDEMLDLGGACNDGCEIGHD